MHQRFCILRCAALQLQRQMFPEIYPKGLVYNRCQSAAKPILNQECLLVLWLLQLQATAFDLNLMELFWVRRQVKLGIKPLVGIRRAVQSAGCCRKVE